MKTTTFKGTDTIATILASFGKIKTNGTKSFTITITNLESALATVAVPAIANKTEKESAFAVLTSAERATLESLQAKVKAEESRLAKLRVQGQTSERWTTTGIASID
jgi:hypothetical protein